MIKYSPLPQFDPNLNTELWNISYSINSIIENSGGSDISSTDELPEGSVNLYYTDSRVVDAQVQVDWNAIDGKGEILNKPTLSTVAISGSYNDLSNKPSIPEYPTTIIDVTTSSFTFTEATTKRAGCVLVRRTTNLAGSVKVPLDNGIVIGDRIELISLSTSGLVVEAASSSGRFTGNLGTNTTSVTIPNGGTIVLTKITNTLWNYYVN